MSRVSSSTNHGTETTDIQDWCWIIKEKAALRNLIPARKFLDQAENRAVYARLARYLRASPGPRRPSCALTARTTGAR